VVTEVIWVEPLRQINDDGLREPATDHLCRSPTGLVAVHQEDDPRHLAQQILLLRGHVSAKQGNGRDSELVESEGSPWTFDKDETTMTVMSRSVVGIEQGVARQSARELPLAMDRPLGVEMSSRVAERLPLGIEEAHSDAAGEHAPPVVSPDVEASGGLW
jgi:hypothetical protein